MYEANSPREWRLYIDDMIAFAEKAIRFTDGIEQAGFVSDDMRFDVTVRNLELMGEAATRIPDTVRQSHPEIPWRLIVAVRNRLIHGYLGIDNDTLWSIIKPEVPALLPKLTPLASHNQS